MTHTESFFFRGCAPATLDAKSRLILPATFRERLLIKYGRELFLTCFEAMYISIYPLLVWEEQEKKLLTLPMTNEALEDYIFQANSYGHECSLDNQGRILIPPVLRQFSGIDREVMVVGSLNRMQLWSKDKFEQRRASLKPFKEIKPGLENLGL